MKKSVALIASILLAASFSSPVLAGHGKGKGGGGGGGGENQGGGLPALEDRVEADEALIATLQGLVTTLQGQVADLQGQNNWAVVASDGTLVRSQSSAGVVSVDAHTPGTGLYEVLFNKDISGCA